MAFLPICWSYPDPNQRAWFISQRKTGVSRIQHVMLKIYRSEQGNARTVENMHCWSFNLFILFYSFKGIMLNLCLFSFTHSTPYPLAGFRLLLQLLVEHPFGQLVMTTSEDFCVFRMIFILYQYIFTWKFLPDIDQHFTQYMQVILTWSCWMCWWVQQDVFVRSAAPQAMFLKRNYIGSFRDTG